jgi:alpha-beta hydrolase superfamily lysophospholipase
MGTGTTPDVALHVARAVVRIVKRFHGRDYKSRFVTNFLFAGDYHKFNMDGSVPEDSWLSTNVESVRKYYADPMDTYLFSVNGYLGLIRAMYFDNQIRNIEKIRKDLPVLFVSGANDPVGSLGKGVKKAYEKFQKAGLKDVTMRLYEGDRHEILQEMDREKVFSDLYQWMIRQIG